jgi:hypothetical protein
MIVNNINPAKICEKFTPKILTCSQPIFMRNLLPKISKMSLDEIVVKHQQIQLTKRMEFTTKNFSQPIQAEN